MDAIIEDTLVLAQEAQTVVEQEYTQMEPLVLECWKMVKQYMTLSKLPSHSESIMIGVACNTS
jgi:hypothetical protein